MQGDLSDFKCYTERFDEIRFGDSIRFVAGEVSVVNGNSCVALTERVSNTELQK